MVLFSSTSSKAVIWLTIIIQWTAALLSPLIFVNLIMSFSLPPGGGCCCCGYFICWLFLALLFGASFWSSRALRCSWRFVLEPPLWNWSTREIVLHRGPSRPQRKFSFRLFFLECSSFSSDEMRALDCVSRRNTRALKSECKIIFIHLVYKGGLIYFLQEKKFKIIWREDLSVRNWRRGTGPVLLFQEE